MRAGGKQNLGKVHGNKQQVTAPEKGKIPQRFLKEYSQRKQKRGHKEIYSQT